MGETDGLDLGLPKNWLESFANSIAGVGVDLSCIDRILALKKRYAPAVLLSLFTKREMESALRCTDEGEAFAVRFAAKEAAGKALGTGLSGIAWNEVEVQVIGSYLYVTLSGGAAAVAARLAVTQLRGIWKRCGRNHVLALAIAECDSKALRSSPENAGRVRDCEG